VEKSTVPCRTAQLVAETVSISHHCAPFSYRHVLTLLIACHAPPWRPL
jgi:hypothetical protein